MLRRPQTLPHPSRGAADRSDAEYRQGCAAELTVRSWHGDTPGRCEKKKETAGLGLTPQDYNRISATHLNITTILRNKRLTQVYTGNKRVYSGLPPLTNVRDHKDGANYLVTLTEDGADVGHERVLYVTPRVLVVSDDGANDVRMQHVYNNEHKEVSFEYTTYDEARLLSFTDHFSAVYVLTSANKPTIKDFFKDAPEEEANRGDPGFSDDSDDGDDDDKGEDHRGQHNTSDSRCDECLEYEFMHTDWNFDLSSIADNASDDNTNPNPGDLHHTLDAFNRPLPILVRNNDSNDFEHVLCYTHKTQKHVLLKFTDNEMGAVWEGVDSKLKPDDSLTLDDGKLISTDSETRETEELEWTVGNLGLARMLDKHGDGRMHLWCWTENAPEEHAYVTTESRNFYPALKTTDDVVFQGWQHDDFYSDYYGEPSDLNTTTELNVTIATVVPNLVQQIPRYWDNCTLKNGVVTFSDNTKMKCTAQAKEKTAFDAYFEPQVNAYYALDPAAGAKPPPQKEKQRNLFWSESYRTKRINHMFNPGTPKTEFQEFLVECAPPTPFDHYVARPRGVEHDFGTTTATCEQQWAAWLSLGRLEKAMYHKELREQLAGYCDREPPKGNTTLFNAFVSRDAEITNMYALNVHAAFKPADEVRASPDTNIASGLVSGANRAAGIKLYSAEGNLDEDALVTLAIYRIHDVVRATRTHYDVLMATYAAKQAAKEAESTKIDHGLVARANKTAQAELYATGGELSRETLSELDAHIVHNVAKITGTNADVLVAMRAAMHAEKVASKRCRFALLEKYNTAKVGDTPIFHQPTFGWKQPTNGYCHNIIVSGVRMKQRKKQEGTAEERRYVDSIIKVVNDAMTPAEQVVKTKAKWSNVLTKGKRPGFVIQIEVRATVEPATLRNVLTTIKPQIADDSSFEYLGVKLNNSTPVCMSLLSFPNEHPLDHLLDGDRTLRKRLVREFQAETQAETVANDSDLIEAGRAAVIKHISRPLVLKKVRRDLLFNAYHRSSEFLTNTRARFGVPEPKSQKDVRGGLVAFVDDNVEQFTRMGDEKKKRYRNSGQDTENDGMADAQKYFAALSPWPKENSGPFAFRPKAYQYAWDTYLEHVWVHSIDETTFKPIAAEIGLVASKELDAIEEQSKASFDARHMFFAVPGRSGEADEANATTTKGSTAIRAKSTPNEEHNLLFLNRRTPLTLHLQRKGNTDTLYHEAFKSMMTSERPVHLLLRDKLANQETGDDKTTGLVFASVTDVWLEQFEKRPRVPTDNHENVSFMDDSLIERDYDEQVGGLRKRLVELRETIDSITNEDDPHYSSARADVKRQGILILRLLKEAQAKHTALNSET